MSLVMARIDQAFVQPAHRLVAYVRAPLGLAGNPLLQSILERAQLEEVVRGVAELGCRAVPRAADVDEVGGIERPSACVALVAAGAGVVAVGALSFDEAVGQEPFLGYRVRHRLGRLVQEPAVMERLEKIVGDLAMIIGIGVRVDVVGESHGGQAVRPDLVVPLRNDLGFYAFVGGPERGGGPVHVAAGDHDCVVADQPVVAHEDVGRGRSCRRCGRGAGARLHRAMRPRQVSFGASDASTWATRWEGGASEIVNCVTLVPIIASRAGIFTPSFRRKNVIPHPFIVSPHPDAGPESRGGWVYASP